MKPQQDSDPMALPGSSIHPVEELQKKGIRQLRIIAESQLKQAAREAVAQALLETVEGLEIPEQVRQELRIRAAIILGQEQPISTDGPSQIQKPTQHLAPPLVLGPISNHSQDVSLGTAEVEENPPGSPLGKREKALLLQLSRLIAQDWRSELATVRDSHRDQVGRLEMRIQELTMALQATDQVLEMSAKTKQEKTEITTPFDDKKSELLDQLFQANVALRALSEGPGQGISPSRDGEGK